MKVKFTQSRIQPIGMNCDYLLKIAFTLVILFACYSAGAQGTTAKDPAPVANIMGNGIGLVNGGHIFVTAEIRAGSNPTVVFTLDNNHSGATIVSQGTFVYDSNTGVGTQIVEIAPGNTKGNFHVKVNVTNANGNAEAVMTAAATDKLK